MPQAVIQINAVTGSDLTISYGDTVQLSNDNIGDESTYTWTFVSKPTGSTAAFSNATITNPTFTADVEGTYLIQLVVDATLAGEDTDRVVVAVKQARSGIRIPAPSEQLESDTAPGRTAGQGWAPDLNEALLVLDQRTRTGLDIICFNNTGIAAGKFVSVSGQGLCANGEQIPQVSLADGSLPCAGVIIERMTHDTDLVVVRKVGILAGVDTSGKLVGAKAYINPLSPGNTTYTAPSISSPAVFTVAYVNVLGAIFIDAPGDVQAIGVGSGPNWDVISSVTTVDDTLTTVVSVEVPVAEGVYNYEVYLSGYCPATGDGLYQQWIGFSFKADGAQAYTISPGTIQTLQNQADGIFNFGVSITPQFDDGVNYVVEVSGPGPLPGDYQTIDWVGKIRLV